MNVKRFRRPSPAFVVAMIALFVALGGTAGAVATQAVPLAKRALVADNAKKLGGQTSAQITAKAAAAGAQAALAQSPAGPRPASTAAGLVTIKTSSASLGPQGDGEFTVTCDTGQKVTGGGFSSPGSVLSLDSFPASDSSWRVYLVNLSSAAGASITLYANCIR
jgi:hypothetical protein